VTDNIRATLKLSSIDSHKTLTGHRPSSVNRHTTRIEMAAKMLQMHRFRR